MNRLSSSVLSFFILLLLILHLPACEHPEAAEVRASYDRLNQHFNSREGEKAVELLAPRSIRQYEQLLPYARTGTRDQIAALPAADRYQILMMRNRLTSSELESLDARAYLILGTDRGWFADDSATPTLELGRMSFNGASASAEIVIDGDRTGHYYDFDLIDGVWKLDWVRFDELLNSWVADWAAEYGATEDEVLIEWEEEESGQPMRDNIWDP